MDYASRYLNTLEVTMNAFCEHHQHNIRFHYRCFDRILLNAIIQPFQQPERVIGFFNTYRRAENGRYGHMRTNMRPHCWSLT